MINVLQTCCYCVRLLQTTTNYTGYSMDDDKLMEAYKDAVTKVELPLLQV